MRPSPPLEARPEPVADVSATTPARGVRRWLGVLIVTVVAIASFLPGVSTQPTFADETAYVAQSYFFDLWMAGKGNDWSWVEYHAYDLPPLPKYLFGAALHAAGRPIPDRLTAGLWFQNNINRELVPRASILAARWPTFVLGVAGCLALYALGSIGVGTRIGLAAALLLAINPLYRLHSQRAMSDVPAECFLMLCMAAGILAWRTILQGKSGRGFAWMAVAGVLSGLAVLSKLNGMLAGMVLVAWCGLGIAFSPKQWLAFAASAVLSIFTGLATFVILNPYVTAHPAGPRPPMLMAPAPPDEGPLDRLIRMVRHRVDVSDRARESFPHNALHGPIDKLSAVAVQGFGRFGPLGPTDHSSTVAYERFDIRRDWGALPWLLVVACGVFALAHRGLAQLRDGMPPTAWPLLVLAAFAFVVVTAFIPLAWDRYYLSLQPSAALLGASAIVEATRLATSPPHRRDARG